MPDEATTGGRINLHRARETESCDRCRDVIVAGDLMGHTPAGSIVCWRCSEAPAWVTARYHPGGAS